MTHGVSLYLCLCLMCKSAIKTRNKALKLVQKYPTQQNIENYRGIRAQTRLVIKTSKRHSW